MWYHFLKYFRKFRGTSKLGKSGEIIIKHEISGHMNKYDPLENKIIYPAFFIKGSHEPKKPWAYDSSLKESTNIWIQEVSWYRLLWIQEDVSQCLLKPLKETCSHKLREKLSQIISCLKDGKWKREINGQFSQWKVSNMVCCWDLGD